jgi:hypothetical protein
MCYEHIPHSCIHIVVKEMQRTIFDMRRMRVLDICVQCPCDRDVGNQKRRER